MPDDRDLERAPEAELVEAPDEPPVVARLVVEIRSDGTRTIARGAIEDRTQGQSVGLKVEGRTPLELAASLARAMFQMPSLAARSTVRSLLSGRKKK